MSCSLIWFRKLLACAFVAALSTSASAQDSRSGSRGPALPKGFTEKTANVNGVRLNYKIGGKGPAVVLLHG